MEEIDMSPESSAQPTRRIHLTSTVALSFIFLVIFSGAVIIAGLSYPPKAASIPLLVGGVGAALSLLQLIIELRASRSSSYEERIDLKKDIPIYLWVWAFVIAIVMFGFLLAAPPMLFIYLKFRSRESWRLSIALSLGVFALLYGLFQIVLGVPLFEGLITPMAVDWLWPSS
jgi:hypothetical protein